MVSMLTQFLDHIKINADRTDLEASIHTSIVHKTASNHGSYGVDFSEN